MKSHLLPLEIFSLARSVWRCVYLKFRRRDWLSLFLGIFAKKYCFIDNFFFKYHQDGLFL